MTTNTSDTIGGTTHPAIPKSSLRRTLIDGCHKKTRYDTSNKYAGIAILHMQHNLWEGNKGNDVVLYDNTHQDNHSTKNDIRK